FEDPGDERDERGLATAVAADDADPVTGGDTEGHAVQQRFGAVGVGHRLQVDQVHRLPRLSGFRGNSFRTEAAGPMPAGARSSPWETSSTARSAAFAPQVSR